MSSATEGRALVPVARELTRRGVAVSLLDGGPIGVGNATDVLPDDLPCERLGLMSQLTPRAILERHGAAVVILGNDNLYLTRQLVRAARSRGLKTVLVQEGATQIADVRTIVRGPMSAISDLRRTAFHARLHAASGDLGDLARRAFATSLGRPVQSSAYGFGGADVFCVANEEVARAFRAVGCSSRMLVTGIPCLVAEPQPANIASSQYDVMYISAPLSEAGLMREERYRDYIRRVFHALSEALPQATLAVKVHPSVARLGAYDWLVSFCPGLAVVDEHDRAASVTLARAYLSFGSTLMLDVWMARRLGLCLVDDEVPQSLQTTDTYRLARAHGAVVAVLSETSTELRRRLTESNVPLFDAARRDYGSSVGDSAARRIADVVEELVREVPVESGLPT